MSRTKTLTCRAVWSDGIWLAGAPEHGVYGQGTTLRLLHDNLAQALALIGITTPVTLVPDSAGLERLRAAHAAYQKALTRTVKSMTADGISDRDIALATGTSLSDVDAARSRTRSRTPAPKPSTSATGRGAPPGAEELRPGGVGAQAVAQPSPPPG